MTVLSDRFRFGFLASLSVFVRRRTMTVTADERGSPDRAQGFSGGEAQLPASPLGKMSRSATFATSAALVFACTACGAARARPVPNVAGVRLDVAENTLDAKDFRYQTVGGGAFGIVVRSHWIVCKQSPAPHSIASSVTLTVARSCSVPDVVGESLDDAEDELAQAGIEVREHSLDGDPILVESLWSVCKQSPAPGAPERPVELYVAHDCWDYSE